MEMTANQPFGDSLMKRIALALASVTFVCSAYSAEVAQETGVLFSPQSDPGSYSMSLEFPNLTISDYSLGDDLYHEFFLPEAGFLGQPGAPQLPSVQKLIEIPDRAGVELHFVGGDFELVENLNVLPEQARLHNAADLPLVWLKDDAIYESDAFFPSDLSSLSDPALVRNNRIIKASFFPVQVNPVSGVTKIWSRMEFELRFAGENTINQKTFELAGEAVSLDRVLRTELLDPTQPDGAMSAWHDAGALPGNYLVFVRSAALSNSYFQNLLDWKRTKGHRVDVLTENDISFSVSGIQGAVSSAYTGPNPPAFVLLVGDVDGSYPLPTDYNQYDHIYSRVDGTDILGDVAVGRLSVGNSTQLATVCNKILAYEQGPYLSDDSWLGHAGLTVGSSVCGMSMKTLSRGIAAELVTRRSYTDIDTAFCAGSSHVVTWLNEGISIYNYRGWIGMEGLSQGEIQSLTQGPMTPVATLFTCDTGDFQYGDDYTEAFLLAGDPATPGGAIACAGFATSATHTRYNNVVCGGFYGALLEHDVPEVGSCLLQGKYELYYTLPPGEQDNATNFANWANLMGDPGTPLWAGVPANLASTIPSSLGLGANQLDLVFTSSAMPIENLAVCAYMESADLQVVGLTDANGRVILSLDGLESGTLKLTVTHHRYATYSRTITVGATAADPAISTWSISGDQMAEAGLANQPVSFTLRNSGTSTLSNISITPLLDAVYGTVNAPTLSISSLSPGATHVFSGTTLTPLGDLVSGTALPLQLLVETSQGDFTLLIPAVVGAPALSLDYQSYPGGVLDPGDSDTVRLGVLNDGNIAGSNLTVTLVSLEPDYLTVLSGPMNLGSLAVGAMSSPTISVSVANSVLPGEVLAAQLNWTSHSANISGTMSVEIGIGSPGQDDPTADDGYGYFAFENLDAGYMQTPSFNWYAISSPEGGSGTELAIHDDSNEGDDGVMVDLPFNFTFYGKTYDEMLVCSNGFVAFDDAGFGEWDFRNHSFPTSIGPDAMIAPMWDDHLTTGSTHGVWTYFDAAQDAFVVSWYDLATNGGNGYNTFQLVLYDPTIHVTITGDAPFKFQYQDFNDVQSNSTDFPYCAAGFKDETSTRGMTLVNYHTYPSTMHTIADGRAIYISTMMGEFVDTLPPVISLPVLGPIYADEAATILTTISDYSGVASAHLSWRVDGSSWNQITMSGDGNQWTAEIPGQASGALVEFFVDAVDASEGANAATSAIASYVPTSEIFFEGFDGTSSFTHSSGGGLTDMWHLETARSYEGTHSWKFGGTGTSDYSNLSGGVLTSPMIDIPDGATNMDLGFWARMDGEVSGYYPDSCYDGGYMEFNLDGAGWERALLPYTHHLRDESSVTDWFGFPVDLFSGSLDWTRYEFDVPDGSTSLQVRFLFGADGGATREGWYLDEFLLTGFLPATALDPVTDLVIYASGGVATLTWTPVPGAFNYNVYAMDEGYGEPVLIGTTGNPFFQDAMAGAARFYIVRAVD
jgi:hypothetical protein